MYPEGWLHCQSAQHPTVTSDAPLLDYEGLNPRSCRPLMHLKTIACTAFVAPYNSFSTPIAEWCTEFSHS